MVRQTATIRVKCRADSVDETAQLLAWAVGYPVAPAEPAESGESRWLLVRTDIAYEGDSEAILERLGLDMIARISGVQYWEVAASDPSAPNAAALDAPESVLTAPPPGVEEQLIAALMALPTPIALMPRGNGRYVWKWMEATGEAPTFVGALHATLRHITDAYLAIQAEAHVAEERATTAGLSDRELEFRLKQALYALPLPIAIEGEEPGAFRWRWREAAGETERFAPAVVAALTHLLDAYAMARGALLTSSGEALEL
jgi:hypothetical protein